MIIHSKSELEIILSHLKTIDNISKVKYEQYQTDSSTAASVLWFLYLNNQIKNKIVADLGCGNGILGIGALLLGAKFCYFIEIDPEVIKILINNMIYLKNNFNLCEDRYKIINTNVSNFNRNVDIVIENPPFGTKKKHADKIFLETAFRISNSILSFHKTSTIRFVKAISKDYGFHIKSEIPLNIKLKKTMSFHKSLRKSIDVSAYWIIK